MTGLSTTALLTELRSTAALILEKSAALTDSGISAATDLPGWSRGHVLAHLSGVTNAMARQAEYAARGEKTELYDGGFEGRTKAIELAAGHGAAEQHGALESALNRALAAFDALDDEGWMASIAYRNGVVLDGGLALWRELVIHLSDLGVGRGPETWTEPFCRHLFDFLSARVPADLRLRLQPLGLAPLTLGNGSRSVSISGMLTDIAAWLAGRTAPTGSLRATAAADAVDLPALLPWPAGVPEPR